MNGDQPLSLLLMDRAVTSLFVYCSWTEHDKKQAMDAKGRDQSMPTPIGMLFLQPRLGMGRGVLDKISRQFGSQRVQEVKIPGRKPEAEQQLRQQADGAPESWVWRNQESHRLVRRDTGLHHD